MKNNVMMRKSLAFGMIGLLLLASIPLASCIAGKEPLKAGKEGIKVKFRGIWREGDEKGKFGGVIIHRGKVNLLRGLWELSNGSKKGKVLGIMRRGYLVGRLIDSNGSKQPLVGLYKINREKKVLMMKWMTPSREGKAVAKIIIGGRS